MDVNISTRSNVLLKTIKNEKAEEINSPEFGVGKNMAEEMPRCSCRCSDCNCSTSSCKG